MSDAPIVLAPAVPRVPGLSLDAPKPRRVPLELASDRQPWERQPQESGIAFEAFKAYRDLGARRTVVRAARKVGKDQSGLLKWTRRNLWNERATAWDVEQDKLTRASLMGEVIAAQRVRLQHGSTMIRRASADLAKTKRALSPMEAARIAEVGGKLTQVGGGGQRPMGPVITVEQAVFALAQDRADPRSVTD